MSKLFTDASIANEATPADDDRFMVFDPTTGKISYITKLQLETAIGGGGTTEGTFTPTIYDASTGGNQGTATAGGRYIKIGSLVYIEIDIQNIDTTGMTAGNNVFIRDLPYTASSTAPPAYGILNCGFRNVTIGHDYVARISSGTSYIQFFDYTALTNGTNNLIISDITSGTGDIWVAGHYTTGL